MVAEMEGGTVRTFEARPADFGLPEAPIEGLKGGEPALNARLLMETLQGKAGASRVAALMTAAAGLVVTGAAGNFRDGAAKAAEALDSGKALTMLDRMRVLAPVPKP
jgi:anthranilate phosphoribosyltransferase